MSCQAVRYSDEMYCAKCNLRWDVNDPEPPKCRDEVVQTGDLNSMPQSGCHFKRFFQPK